jgi:hypothetical protein
MESEPVIRRIFRDEQQARLWDQAHPAVVSHWEPEVLEPGIYPDGTPVERKDYRNLK